MAYIGNDLQVAFPSYRIIDDISSGFNGSQTTFALTVSGATPVPFPINPQQCLISVNGVIQKPDPTGAAGFNLVGSNIVFASAPTGGWSFFGVILAGADYVNVGANFPSGTAAAPSITFDSDLDTGIYNSGANQVSIATAGVERFRVDSAGQLEAVSLGSAASPAFSFTTDTNTGIYSPGADQLAISTNGTGRLFINSAGNAVIGSSTAQAFSGFTTLTLDNATNGGVLCINKNAVNMGNISAVNDALTIDAANGGSSPIVFRTGVGTTERLRITSAGLVGIGVSAPSVRCQIDDAANSAPVTLLRLNNTGTTAGGPGIASRLTFTAGSTGLGFIQGANHASGKSSVQLSGDNSNVHATLTSDGYLGIGTTAPSSKLSIAYGDAGLNGMNIEANINGTGEGLRINANTRTSADDATALLRVIDRTNADALRVNVNGRVGIGTNNPQSLLHLDTDGTALRIVRGSSIGFAYNTGTASTSPFRIQSNSGSVDLYSAAGQPITFSAGGTEKAQVDGSGRLLVGTSTARSNFYNDTNSARFQVEGTDNDGAAIAVVQNFAANTIGAQLILAKSNLTSVGSNTLVAAGDRFGTISFQGNDGAQFVEAASITAYVDGTPGANDMPGRLVFSTTADGASSPTERMRIRNDGYVLFNTTSEVSAGGVGAQIGFSGQNYWRSRNSGTSSYGHLAFYNDNGQVGTISTSGSSTAYNTSSDYRLKENVTAVTDGITRLQQLKPSRFNFITDPDTTVDGFLAHEVQDVVPEAITGEKDAVDDDGNPVYQGIDQSKLVPLLTAALQEAVSEINALKDRVAALEGA